jgi:hypothetical protein
MQQDHKIHVTATARKTTFLRVFLKIFLSAS